MTKKLKLSEKLIILGLVMLIVYTLVYLFYLEDYVRYAMAALLVLTAVLGGWSLIRHYDSETLTRLIILAGLIMRVGYMLYTPCTLRSHDLLDLSPAASGHAAYILTLLEGRLPATNEWQFYQPPLYYALSAAVITVLRPLLRLNSGYDLVNCARLVSCFFSCLTLYCAEALCAELRLKKPLPLALIAFLPGLYLIGGRVNNDMLAIFFSMAVLLYSLRWYREQSVKNTVILALCFALGLLSKLSVAVLALPTGLMMLYVLIKSIKAREAGAVIRRLCLFAAVSLPLGLSYALRNLILFAQPLNYVPDAGGSGFASELYSLGERFLTFPVTRLFEPVYNKVFDDYNVWVYLIKSALFGEFSYKVPDFIALALIAVFTLVSFALLAAAVRTAWTRDSGRRFLLLSAAVLLGSYIVFNIDYPYGCTMDFRYIVPVYLVNALLLGGCIQDAEGRRFGKPLKILASTLTAAFSVLSMLMYCLV